MTGSVATRWPDHSDAVDARRTEAVQKAMTHMIADRRRRRRRRCAPTTRARRALERRGIDIDAIKAKVAAFAVAVPSWGVGTGGTRFARFPGPGEPRDIFDKLEDCAVIHQLTRATPRVSLHIPWDKADADRAEAGAQRASASASTR